MTDHETIEAAEALLEHPCLSNPTNHEDFLLAAALHRWCSHNLREELQREGES